MIFARLCSLYSEQRKEIREKKEVAFVRAYARHHRIHILFSLVLKRHPKPLLICDFIVFPPPARTRALALIRTFIPMSVISAQLMNDQAPSPCFHIYIWVDV